MLGKAPESTDVMAACGLLYLYNSLASAPSPRTEHSSTGSRAKRARERSHTVRCGLKRLVNNLFSSLFICFI